MEILNLSISKHKANKSKLLQKTVLGGKALGCLIAYAQDCHTTLLAVELASRLNRTHVKKADEEKFLNYVFSANYFGKTKGKELSQLMTGLKPEKLLNVRALGFYEPFLILLAIPAREPHSSADLDYASFQIPNLSSPSTQISPISRF
ncbi:hypothetical protein BT69DRAFT_541095 [Atractiella rhizophila]|nr:hypothetical protein BT69DRAFT_541095 [Atractiella rhizophila]